MNLTPNQRLLLALKYMMNKYPEKHIKSIAHNEGFYNSFLVHWAGWNYPTAYTINDQDLLTVA